MRKISVVIGLKANPGRVTKFKLAIISPTKAGEKPEEILFQKCVEADDNGAVSGVIADAKQFLNKIEADIEVINSLYVSQGEDVLKNTDSVDESLFARIQKECGMLVSV